MDRQGGDRQLEQLPSSGELPPVRLDRTEPVAEAAKQFVPLAPLLPRERGGAEVIRPRERTNERGQGGRVVDVALIHQDLEQLGRPTVTRAPETDRPHAGGSGDRLLRPDDLGLGTLAGEGVEEGLVLERVVADFVTPLDDGAKDRLVLRRRRIGTDHEERE